MGPCACKYYSAKKRENEIHLNSQSFMDPKIIAAKTILKHYRRYKKFQKPKILSKLPDFEKFIHQISEIKSGSQLVEVF